MAAPVESQVTEQMIRSEKGWAPVPEVDDVTTSNPTMISKTSDPSIYLVAHKGENPTNKQQSRIFADGSSFQITTTLFINIRSCMLYHDKARFPPHEATKTANGEAKHVDNHLFWKS
jgi:hypothetical protein